MKLWTVLLLLCSISAFAEPKPVEEIECESISTSKDDSGTAPRWSAFFKMKKDQKLSTYSIDYVSYYGNDKANQEHSAFTDLVCKFNTFSLYPAFYCTPTDRTKVTLEGERLKDYAPSAVGIKYIFSYYSEVNQMIEDTLDLRRNYTFSSSLINKEGSLFALIGFNIIMNDRDKYDCRVK